jgi:hypothetical protein
MSIHHQPIEQRIDWLFDLAERHTAEFRSPDACLARDLYQAKHPTAIVVLKCMDGRINIPIVTGTPPGIIQPFRNLGGMFDLGWPHLGEIMANHVKKMVDAGRRVLILITYHFSQGSVERGCAGFAYDTEAARAHTLDIKQQLESIFGKDHATVYPVICGLETDEDALRLHGNREETLDLARLQNNQDAELRQNLAEMYPDMPDQVMLDLQRLLVGNLQWIAEVRRSNRPLEIEHREWMICLGRGFDFLHTPNLALIIGPYSPDLADPIRKAAGIIESNMNAGRIPDDGFLLLASVPYEEIGVDRARAELKSHFLARFAAEVIETNYPQLSAKMHTRKTVLSWNSRALQIIAED